jgi:hypothetical protein
MIVWPTTREDGQNSRNRDRSVHTARSFFFRVWLFTSVVNVYPKQEVPLFPAKENYNTLTHARSQRKIHTHTYLTQHIGKKKKREYRSSTLSLDFLSLRSTRGAHTYNKKKKIKFT